MAADVRARTDKQGTIAFTLPISCQICLGKVKKPVLCSNNHVFCSPCMDVWLQRNQQCPACRIPINTTNPLKQIIGGINHIENDKDKMSNPDLRKARFDLLFKEYEDEFQRMTSELNLIRSENDMLRSQLAKDGNNKKVLGPRDKDSSTMLTLTKKLQDAQKLYEKVKSDLGKVKEENNSLKDENINLNHENQKLRTEIASRSPHRYGRYTVSTLETKVQSLEKETGRMNKALEKSDKYIEELEKELENYRGKDKYQSSTQRDYRSSLEKSELDNPSKRQLFTEPLTNGESYRHALDDDYLKPYKTTKSNLKNRNGSIDNDYLSSYQSQSYGKTNGKSGKRVTFDLPADKNVTTSFDLEMPSPMKQNSSLSSPVKGVLKSKKKSSNDSLDLSKPSSIEDTRSYKYSKDDSDLYLSKSKPSSVDRYDDDSWKKSTKQDDYLNDSFTLENPRKSYKGERDFDDTQQIQRELDDLDISLTPDFTDCMKLLNRAEKKVHNMNDDSLMDLPSNYHNGGDFSDDFKSRDLDDYRSKDRLVDDLPVTRSYIPESTYSSKYYSSNIPSSSGELYPPSSLPSYSASYKPSSIDYNQTKSSSDRKYNTDISNYKSSLDTLDYKLKDDNLSGSTYSSAANRKYPTSLRFGRSPSLDNLYISKPVTNTTSGSRTVEDLPNDYKVRSSLPDFTSSRFSDDRLGKNYLSSLPPRPQSSRGRSYSDMGTAVSSLSRGKPSLDPTNSVPDTTNSVSSALYSVDKPPLYTASTQPIGNGPIRAQQNFAYTDVELGVNPRNRSSIDGLRTRSSSLDIPLTEITKYSSTQSNPEYPVSFTGSSESTRYSAPYIPSSSSVTTSVGLNPIQETGYSYISNNSSLGNGTDSYLPEPKKRLFDSSDDLEMSLSPIKATRKI